MVTFGLGFVGIKTMRRKTETAHLNTTGWMEAKQPSGVTRAAFDGHIPYVGPFAYCFVCDRNWHLDEPSCGYEVCVVMYHQPSAPPGQGGPYMFQWNDDNCETKNNFICKYTKGWDGIFYSNNFSVNSFYL